MQNFFSSSTKDLNKIHSLIFFNGKSLYKDANLLATANKSYASATSLLVLSTEEYIKSILILLETNGYDVFKNSKSRKFFKDHKIRHNIAQIIELISFFFDTGSEITAKYKKRKTNNSKFSWIIETIIILLRSFDNIKLNEDRILFLSEFNNLKNNGLYVGFKDQISIPSKVINESKYIKTKEINERISNFYKVLRMLFHPKVDRHINPVILRTYQKSLKQEISKLLKETELTDLKNEIV